MWATSDGWLIVWPAPMGSAPSSQARSRSCSGTKRSRGTRATASTTRVSRPRRRREARSSSRCIPRPQGTVRRMVPSLWVARHGETAWTLSRQHTGRTDLALTAEGERQARDELGPKLAGASFDLVLSSPLQRARQTARAAGFEPELDERLREFDYGDYEGLTTAEILAERPGWDMWADGCPGGETAADVGARMDDLIAERLRAGGERILIFGHGHALRILAARWLGLAAAEGRAFLLPPAALGITGAEHGRAVLA